MANPPLFGSIDTGNLQSQLGGYDQSFQQFVDNQGNVLTPTYGGEMNTPVSYQGTKVINGDVVNVTYDANGNIVAATGQPVTVDGKQYVADYSSTGGKTYREYTTPGQFSDIADAIKYLGPIALTAGGAGPISSAIGSATGLTGSALSAATGATLGAGSAALTGNNIVKGALLGGAGGYLSGALNAGITDKAALQAAMDADIAGGMVPEYGTNSAYDAFMNEAMTPAARTALETMINSGNGAWLGENVPSGVPEWDTAFTNAGGTFDTSYVNPVDLTNVPEAGFENWTPNGTDVSNVGPDTITTPKVVTPDTKTVTPDLKTVTDLAKVISLGGGLLGGSKLVSNALTPTPAGTTTAPTQTVPVGNQDYYNAIQQYYNAYMPAQPRDIATPLQNWYSKKYGA